MKAKLKKVLYSNRFKRCLASEENTSEWDYFVTDKKDDIEDEWPSNYHYGQTSCLIASLHRMNETVSSLASKYGSDFYVYMLRKDDERYEEVKETLLLNDWELLEQKDLDTVVRYIKVS